MDDDLKEALRELEYAHAVIWTHFDPGMDRGDEKQPEEIKALLKRLRAFSEARGYVFEGWDDDDDQ